MKFNFNAPAPPLSPEDIERVESMNSARNRAIQSYMDAIERAVVERLDIICGRMPSDDEIRQHAHCGIHPDGRREYKWKGETFLIVPPITKGIYPHQN